MALRRVLTAHRLCTSMHTSKGYRLRELLVWTTHETVFMTVVAVGPTLLSVGFG